MSRVEIINSEGNLLGIIDDENNTVEKTEEWKRIQAEARRRRKKSGMSTNKGKKLGQTWTTGY